MARARNIKPGFFKNYELADQGPLAQILFAGLWCLADREGRLEDKPRLIKAEVFPYYDCDVNGELTKLERLSLVSRYSVDGTPVIEVRNFKKHQTPHNTEKASVLPEMPKQEPIKSTACSVNGGLTVDSRNSNGGKTPDSLIHRFTDSLIPDSLIPDSTALRSASAAPRDFEEDQFEIAWSAYPKRPGASKPDSLKGWKARIKAGASSEEIICGVRRYAAFTVASCTEPQYIKQPATFFGSGNHWQADWTAPARAQSAPTDLAAINARNNAEAKRLLFGSDEDEMRTIDA